MKRIDVGVTHEIYINGDKSWVRFAMSEDIDDDSDVDSSVDRLNGYVNSKIMSIIESTVKTVEEYQ